jgi:hypothetical protein
MAVAEFSPDMRGFQFDAHRFESDSWILGHRIEEIDPQVARSEPD